MSQLKPQQAWLGERLEWLNQRQIWIEEQFPSPDSQRRWMKEQREYGQQELAEIKQQIILIQHLQRLHIRS